METEDDFRGKFRTLRLTEKEYNIISREIIESAIEIHKELGPGLMESVYEHCLSRLLREKGFFIENQVPLPIIFRGEKLDKAFTIDILVSNHVILELKAVEKIMPVHEAQLLTYLKLSGKKLGLLINFNEELLKNGIRRKVNGFEEGI